jgi:hypothetical protein
MTAILDRNLRREIACTPESRYAHWRKGAGPEQGERFGRGRQAFDVNDWLLGMRGRLHTSGCTLDICSARPRSVVERLRMVCGIRRTLHREYGV